MLNARSATTDDKQTVHYSVAGPKRVGRFQLFDDELTQFNFDCVNTISEADNTPKNEIQLMWVAPATGSGCVALSAMVYENSHSWYADEGNLTHIICEGAPVRDGSEYECCACDEAKYNVCTNKSKIISIYEIINNKKILFLSLFLKEFGRMKHIHVIIHLPFG